MSEVIDFHEANFVSLPDQSNVYGLVHLNVGDLNKLVVATVRAQILCLEYQRDTVRPLLSPINFTYIPGSYIHDVSIIKGCLIFCAADAEVISIDAFVRKPNSVIIGVTLVKVCKGRHIVWTPGRYYGVVYSLQRDSDPKEFYFNLYGLHSIPSAPFNWDKIAGKTSSSHCIYIAFLD